MEWNEGSGNMNAYRVSSHPYVFMLSYQPLQKQEAEVHELLESGPITHELQDGITAALELLDDLGDNLATFQAKLRHMRRDIESASALLGVLIGEDGGDTSGWVGRRAKRTVSGGKCNQSSCHLEVPGPDLET